MFYIKIEKRWLPSVLGMLKLKKNDFPACWER
jgi:hypothetical protein